MKTVNLYVVPYATLCYPRKSTPNGAHNIYLFMTHQINFQVHRYANIFGVTYGDSTMVGRQKRGGTKKAKEEGKRVACQKSTYTMRSALIAHAHNFNPSRSGVRINVTTWQGRVKSQSET